MEYQPRIPECSPLAPHVEVLFDLMGYLPGHSRERLVPNGRMQLIIELDGRERHVFDNQSGESRQVCSGAWLSGIHSNYIVIGETNAANHLLAVQFAPGGSMPFTHQPAERYCDSVVPAAEVFGDGILDLRGALRTTGSYAERLDRLEAWLVSRFEGSLATPPEVQLPLEVLLETPGSTSLTKLIEQRGETSYRHFVKLFRQHVGPAPKTFQRILRFAQVFARLQRPEDLSWSELSLELGFSDQAHFIREFRAFSGYRPREFQDEGHDRLNFFPDDPQVMPPPD